MKVEALRNDPADERYPSPSRRKLTPSCSGGGSSNGNSSGSSSSGNRRDCSRASVVARVFDEVPTYCRGGSRDGGGRGSDGDGAGVVAAGDDGGCVDATGGDLFKMGVGKWARVHEASNDPLHSP